MRLALRALQEVHARHVLPEGLDPEALAVLAVGGAVVPDGRGWVLPLPPALRGAQAVTLRLVLQETGAQGGSNAGHRAGSQPSPSHLGKERAVGLGFLIMIKVTHSVGASSKINDCLTQRSFLCPLDGSI